MSTSIHQRVELARRGELENLVCRTKSGWLTWANSPYVPGYCVLLPDPVVPSLNDLSTVDRELFLGEMVLIGDCMLKCSDAHRINYEILGNLDPVLHAHIVPRFAGEPEPHRTFPIFYYDWNQSVPPCPENCRFDIDEFLNLLANSFEFKN